MEWSKVDAVAFLEWEEGLKVEAPSARYLRLKYFYD